MGWAPVSGNVLRVSLNVSPDNGLDVDATDGEGSGGGDRMGMDLFLGFLDLFFDLPIEFDAVDSG